MPSSNSTRHLQFRRVGGRGPHVAGRDDQETGAASTSAVSRNQPAPAAARPSAQRLRRAARVDHRRHGGLHPLRHAVSLKQAYHLAL